MAKRFTHFLVAERTLANGMPARETIYAATSAAEAEAGRAKYQGGDKFTLVDLADQIAFYTDKNSVNFRPVYSDGKPVSVGDTILAPFKQGGAGDGARIVQAVVTKVSDVYPLGYGYWSYKLTLAPVGGDKPLTHPNAHNCMLVQRAPC